MTIKFSCPHCKKTLMVKAELAGRRGACPGCKQLVTIPTQHAANPASSGRPPHRPEARREEDLEELAAAALRESREAAAAATLDFTCPYCDAQLHLAAEMAGKQTPCPECRRIIKAPQAPAAARDWRQPDAPRTPSGARIDTAAMPDAWGTQTHRGAASRQALVEAGIIREDHRSPLRKWTTRGLISAAGIALVAAGVWAYFHITQRNLEQECLVRAEEWLKSPAASEQPALRAEMLLLLAEYYLRSDARDAQGRGGVERLKIARDAAARLDDADEKLAGLRAVLEMQITFEHYEDIATTCEKFPGGKPRFEMFKELCRRLVAAGRADLAKRIIQTLVRPVVADNKDRPPEQPAEDYSEQIACLSILGQELASAGQTEEAKKLLEECRSRWRPDLGCPPGFIALHVQLGERLPDLAKYADAAKAHLERALLLGQLEGHLRLGKGAEAAKLLVELKTAPPADYLEGLLLFAARYPGSDRPPGKPHPDNPADDPIAAARFVLSVIRREETAVERKRLAEICLAAGHVAVVQELLDEKEFLAPPALDAIHLALLRRRLASAEGAVDAAALLAEFGGRASAKARACGLIARHNARFGTSAAAAWAEKLDGDQRAFASVGVAVGMRLPP